MILLGFATIVGVLTTRRIQSDFNRQVELVADQLARADRHPRRAGRNGDRQVRYRGPNLEAYAAAQSAVIRVVTEDNEVIKSSPDAPYLAPPLLPHVGVAAATASSRGRSRSSRSAAPGSSNTRAASPTSRPPPTACASSIGPGVLGGTALALLAASPPRGARWPRSPSSTETAAR